MAALCGAPALRRPFVLLAGMFVLCMVLTVLSEAPAYAQTGWNCVLVDDNNAPNSFANLTTGGSIANDETDLACGPDAVASGGNTTAVGSGAIASFTDSTAVGFEAGNLTQGGENTFVGSMAGSQTGFANVDAENNTFVGFSAGLNVNGDNNTAMGHEAGQNVFGESNAAFGAGAGTNVGTAAEDVQGNSAFGAGSGNLVTGDFNTATGFGSGGTAIPGGGGVDGSANLASGFFSGNAVTGNANVAIGAIAGSAVTGSSNIALGTEAGNNITASNTIAVGTGARASADGSIAIGAGATAAQTNQIVLGTSSNTYTAPGITSALSRSRQSGPTQIVTSDANGNLATAGGDFFDKVDENQSGVALAMAIANPDLTGNEKFGVAANYGNFEGANALGMALMGVLGHNFVTANDRVAVSGGFGVGFDNGSGDDVFGGRVGLQWTH
jgi:trimeric autotransporter adhesin